MKFLITLSLGLALVTSLVQAGDSVGNPDFAVVAYDQSAQQVINGQSQLAHLKLTREEVRERREELEDISEYYTNATVGRVINLLEDEYAVDVYHFQDRQFGFYECGLDDDDEIMDAAIRYYCQFDSKHSPFDQVDPSVLPGRGCIVAPITSIPCKILAGENSGYSIDYSSRFLLASAEIDNTNWLEFWVFDTLFSSTDARLYEVPVVYRFLEALDETELKALDATVVFMAGNLQAGRIYGKDGLNELHRLNQNGTCYYTEVSLTQVHFNDGRIDSNASGTPTTVLYPQYSRLAPIPRPMIFISRDATKNDILKMLNDHAGRIYAYNQAFDQRMLPSAQEISNLLEQYPRLKSEVQAAVTRLNITNPIQVVTRAFLALNYAVGAGAVVLPVRGLASVLGSNRGFEVFIRIVAKIN